MTPPLRLDYVSPLPPLPSGIADYSRDLLPHLAPLCDLRVVRVGDQPITEAFEARWHPVSDHVLGEDGRLPLYQMGNNRHHAAVWRLANRTPGVLTLHDVVLHHLLIELTLAEDDFDTYAEHLESDHGWVGATTALAREWSELSDAAMFSLSAHRDLLRQQRGVLVHSRWAAERVRETDLEIPVRVVPMGIPLPEPISREHAQAWRRERDLPDGAPLIGSFGFQTPIKRTDRSILALATDELTDVHLLVGGEVSTGLDLEAIARQVGVTERVHFLGFLDYAEFETAIAACDVCLNLRYPTAGETSASLLRELAVGRPVVVSDYAQFAEVPSEVAIKVALGKDEVGELARTLGELLHNAARLERMSIAARQYIETTHSPEAAAVAIVEACSELAEVEPPGAAREVADPPTSLLWRHLPGRLTVEGAELPWAAGEARRLRLSLHNDSAARWLSADEPVGGVMIDLHWRRTRASRPGERFWIELPRDMQPGDRVEMEVSLRRPIEDANMLVVEPHLRDICGFNAVGGPTWELELE